jgi:hypothetical protein
MVEKEICQECKINEVTAECLECGSLVCDFCFDNYHGKNCMKI